MRELIESLFEKEYNYLLEIGLCSVVILYMQYSKFKWIVADNSSGIIDYFKYCYPEIYFIALFIIVGLFFKRTVYVFILFLAYYYLAVFNFISWFIQGRPFFFVDMYRSIQLFIFYPEFLTEIETALKIKIGFFVFFPLVTIIAARIFRSFVWLRELNAVRFVRRAIPAGAIIVALSFPGGMYAKVFHYSTAVEIASDAYRNVKIQQISLQPDEAFKLMGCNDQRNKQTSAWDFRARNILLFIIETAPYDFYPSLDELCRLTSNNWLAEHGRIYKQHYAPYPESERAIYSIISGHYPPLTNGDTWKRKVEAVGLADFFNSKGYATYFLGTAPLEFHNDRAMVEGLGFESIYNVKETSTARIVVNGKKDWDRTKIYRFDEILKEKALKILSSHGAKQNETKPFFMVLAPQSSHAPFQIPPGDSKVTRDKEKIRLNAIWQFKLLKSLLGELENSGQLENTVVIVTGDHGIRSKYESDLFYDPKLLQSVSFHVPLMVSFAGMESSTVDNYVTSHVDIAPTIINAFQEASNNSKFHGVDLFASDLPKRNVFMFGGGTLPVSGLADNKDFFMENRYLRMYYKSPLFNFDDGFRQELMDGERDRFLEKMMSVQALLLQNNF